MPTFEKMVIPPDKGPVILRVVEEESGHVILHVGWQGTKDRPTMISVPIDDDAMVVLAKGIRDALAHGWIDRD